MIPKFRAWNIESKIMLEHDFIVKTLVQDGKIIRDFSDVINGSDVFILMQSTGLKDKNGKEIFEGDVVKYWENIGYIEFYQGSWVINWNDGSLFDLYDNENNLEIIGNIHEHPELLN